MDMRSPTCTKCGHNIMCLIVALMCMLSHETAADHVQLSALPVHVRPYPHEQTAETCASYNLRER